MSSKSGSNPRRPMLKTHLSSIILISNAFAWYFATYFLIAKFITEIQLGSIESTAVWAANSMAAAFAALFMPAYMNKGTNRERFLMLWMLLGTLSSIVPLAITPSTFLELILIALLWGLSFGLGMPFSMEYYTSHSKLQNRGKIGGVTFLVSYLGNFCFGIIGAYGVEALMLVVVVWRAAGLVLFYFLKPKTIMQSQTLKHPSYSSILRERSFYLYFIPWVMFSLVNYLNMPILREFFGSDFADWSSLVEGFVIGGFAVFGGFMCDIIGRKRMIVLGFVSVGLGYATLSVFPQSAASWYVYTVLDGVGWGMFGVTFVTALWGDLAYEKPSGKYYAIGGLPLLLANLLQVLIGKDLAKSISVYAIFPLISLFLFVAVLPLMYAPETLPEKELRERELKEYANKAKKVKEKYT